MSETTRQLDMNRSLKPFDSLRFGRRRSGFTLAEALLASTILAIVASTATLPFVTGMQEVDGAADLEQATALGEAMMEEVLARPFFEIGQTAPTPGPDTGSGESNRLKFKSLDDFDGFTESVGNLRNFQHVQITDPTSAGFWRTVSVQYVRFPSLGQPVATDSRDPGESFIHVQVHVYHNTTPLVTLDRMVSRED